MYVPMSHWSSLAYLSSWTVLGQDQKIEDQDTESITLREDNDDRLNYTMPYNSLVWLTQVLWKNMNNIISENCSIKKLKI